MHGCIVSLVRTAVIITSPAAQLLSVTVSAAPPRTANNMESGTGADIIIVAVCQTAFYYSTVVDCLVLKLDSARQEVSVLVKRPAPANVG